MNGFPTFSEFFESLWGYEPFPWQSMLADQLVKGEWPRVLDLPTASGKTACMDAAIYALARQAERPLAERTAPRRIWFVVDRRIVVDEAYARAECIASRLRAADSRPLAEVAERLRHLSGTERPLVAARLRGGSLRGDQWGRLPSQPAVITSTVDQLGSRLLFQGYGRSLRTAPIWAGLAANDSLILLDEAHCSVPFLQTLLLIERYRGEHWAERPLRTPFAFSILSATPPGALLDQTTLNRTFPGKDREQALNHPKLCDRLSASKQAELVLLNASKTGDPLVKEAAARAEKYVRSGCVRVAVIVNRVRTAAEIAANLSKASKETFDVHLLTGRLRPFDRDTLVKRLTPLLKANEPLPPERPVILVSTQCIEVGADFSFDAMVTESAALDALRQRFGRLNRMGHPGPAPATILIRAEDAKEKKPEDPVYAHALPRCWELMNTLAKVEGEGSKSRTVLDFGVDSLNALLASADPYEVEQALAPHRNAPVLLPAHLDLLCQTAPPPAVVPDVALFLHGTERGAPEVRVVWRADLEGSDDSWVEAVALCPPVAAEMLTVPLYRLRQWLTEDPKAELDDASDVEGQTTTATEGTASFRQAVLWRGRDRSKLASQAGDIAPDDIVVVPADYGIEGLAPKVERLDIWERCVQQSDNGAALRIHRAVLSQFLDAPGVKELLDVAESDDWDPDAIFDQIQLVLDLEADSQALPDAWRDIFKSCLRGRVEQHPSKGLVVFGKKLKEIADSDLFADDDDLRSLFEVEVPLDRHCEDVARAASRLARHCLPNEHLFAVRDAALWHDAGKLDSRFQEFLRQGHETLADNANPIAKSAFVPTSPAKRKAIREATGLPEGFRHEMLSVDLADRWASLGGGDRDLTLHLIASHHGHARPFAPMVPDPHPPAIFGKHVGVPMEWSEQERAHRTAAHRADSGVSERFWLLNRRYGWWGLAYLEAVVRLSDWYASEYPQHEAESTPEINGTTVGLPHVALPSTDAEIVLTGLDGANPLGFLAAIGTLVTLREAGFPHVRLHWQRSAVWQPVLSGIGNTEESEICSRIADELRGVPVSEAAEAERRLTQLHFDAAKKGLKEEADAVRARKLRGKERQVALEGLAPLRQTLSDARVAWLRALKGAAPRPELALGKHINCTPQEYREDHAPVLLSDSRFDSRDAVDLLAAFASDGCVDKRGVVSAAPFCFISGSGHQYFLDTARSLMDKVTPEGIRLALFCPWKYEDQTLSMRWDPVEDRRYALLDRDPTASDNKSRTVWMANILGYRGLELFTSAPTRRRLETTGWSGTGGVPRFSWPLWRHSISLESVRSLLSLEALQAQKPDRRRLKEIGVEAVFRAQRIQVGNPPLFKVNFSPAVEV